eukprot:m.2667 g.2667  ORF g.2667 m.2667 type:complete len:154 (+) comp8833_c0_seq1:632-1093(+)
MQWLSHQQTRLDAEKFILERYFPASRWIDPTTAGETKVEVEMKANNDKSYTLRLYVPIDLPNSCPVLVIVKSGRELKLKNNDAIPTTSSRYHTLGQKDGYLKICHFHPSHWNPDNTFYLVFMKGRLWIEAFELHHLSGDPLSSFLKEFDKTMT